MRSGRQNSPFFDPARSKTAFKDSRKYSGELTKRHQSETMSRLIRVAACHLFWARGLRDIVRMAQTTLSFGARREKGADRSGNRHFHAHVFVRTDLDRHPIISTTSSNFVIRVQGRAIARQDESGDPSTQKTGRFFKRSQDVSCIAGSD
jgi:hypothetical protein